jgi:hypothetical protein
MQSVGTILMISWFIFGCATVEKKTPQLRQFEELESLAIKNQPVQPVIQYLDKSKIPYSHSTNLHSISLIIHDTDRGAITSESIAMEINYNLDGNITRVVSKKMYTGP